MKHGRQGFAELCFIAADGDPYVALDLAVAFFKATGFRSEAVVSELTAREAQTMIQHVRLAA